MKKLVKGIVEFRKKVLPGYRETFAKLALGQSPDSLYIGCSDSRVAVNLFASTDPGDLFVVRNVGNLVPACAVGDGTTIEETSVAAAIEFAISNLNISSVVICGHSECGAMQALVNGREKVGALSLKNWLRHGEDGLADLKDKAQFSSEEKEHNRLSKINVLKQIEHLKTYPIVQDKLKKGMLTIHGWWFELSKAEVYAYEAEQHDFVLIDEKEAQQIISRLG